MKHNIKLKGKLRNFVRLPILLSALLVLMDIPMYYFDKKAALYMTAFTVIYIAISTVVCYLTKPVLVNELISFATQYGTVQRKLLNEFEVPYVLMDYSGKVLWVNEQFTELTGKTKAFHKSITSIFPSITREMIQKQEDDSDIDISWKEKIYRGAIKKIYFDELEETGSMIQIERTDQFLTVLYLFDETELKTYMRENQDQKMVVALAYIDNYEEALESIDDVKRSLLTALIDRKVTKYFSSVDALVRKIEKDKYFIVLKKMNLKKLEEDKFSILEDVKAVKAGNEMAVTLSVGVGDNGISYNQNFEYSRMAIDLALGRGGDQVVIKDGEDISYYGGKSRQVEKMTRVKARVKAHALREMMESREKVMIMGHNITDVDAFGAAIGIYCAARVLGKHAQIVINEVTTSLRPLKEFFTEEKGYPADLFIQSEEALQVVDKNTLVMVVDTNRPNYTECPGLLNKTKSIVVFDHHRQSSDVIENPVLSYLEPYASSTCEMVAEVLQYFSDNIHLEPHEADCIYAGILIDTNNFMTKTGVRTFEAAAYLRRCGAEVTRVRKLLRNDMGAYKARAEVVRHAEVYRGAFAISVCQAADQLESPTIVGAQAANELLNIIGIKASFVLTEYQGKIYVSSRSIDEINVQLIMEKLGGGGHLSVAGAQLSNVNAEEAKRMIQKTIDIMIKEGEIDS